MIKGRNMISLRLTEKKNIIKYNKKKGWYNPIKIEFEQIRVSLRDIIEIIIIIISFFFGNSIF